MSSGMCMESWTNTELSLSWWPCEKERTLKVMSGAQAARRARGVTRR